VHVIADASDREPVVDVRGLVKNFGHVQALRGANFAIYPQEIVALIGDNGAGKSTLTKILSGALQPTAGEIRVDGSRVHIGTPGEAHSLGIETVYQDLALAPELDSISNLYLGRELTRSGLLGRLGMLDKRGMRIKTQELLGRLEIPIDDATQPVASLSGGQRQGVAVARSMSFATRVLLMDEPTAALGVVQTERMLELIRRIPSHGVSVVLISHNLPQVLEVASRVEVLRLGKRVARFTREQASMESLIAAMTGALTHDQDDALVH
jgi:simple sugar transport system ATP-binding protein